MFLSNKETEAIEGRLNSSFFLFRLKVIVESDPLQTEMPCSM